MRKPFIELFTAVIDRDRITSRLIYGKKIFCTTLFWCSLKRPSVKLTKLLVRCLNVPRKSCCVNLALERLAFVAFWKLTAVMLLLHADWMMVKNAISVTALDLSTRNAFRFESCILENYSAVSTWILNGSSIECQEKKHQHFSLSGVRFGAGDSNFWVKICLVLGSQKRAFHPWLLLLPSFKFTAL